MPGLSSLPFFLLRAALRGIYTESCDFGALLAERRVVAGDAAPPHKYEKQTVIEESEAPGNPVGRRRRASIARAGGASWYGSGVPLKTKPY